jgi:hypothetical protein
LFDGVTRTARSREDIIGFTNLLFKDGTLNIRSVLIRREVKSLERDMQ